MTSSTDKNEIGSVHREENNEFLDTESEQRSAETEIGKVRLERPLNDSLSIQNNVEAQSQGPSITKSQILTESVSENKWVSSVKPPNFAQVLSSLSRATVKSII